ncbi:hypothetical protein V2J09_005171 [Rumex salicifolius]
MAKPGFIPSKFCFHKRINLYFAFAVVFLCSLSYFLGSYHHSSTVSDAASLFSNSSSCSVSIANSSSSFPLDFSSHHSADDLPVTNSLSASAAVERVKHFPPCDIKLSEYTPCHDQSRSLRFPRNRLIYRERHCPARTELLKCRIPAPYGYKTPFRWPESREKVWYANVPHKWLTVEKAGQNWVRFEGNRFTFPGGGTMFPRGANAYIDEIGRIINFKDGSVRTAIDTGCGVASWGAFLLSRNILPLSFAPKDTHDAQVQFALERGIPALIDVLASKRLPYPSRAFDMAHCSRCLIPWGQLGGLYLIEVDRILRPGGYWILSGPPINWQKHWKGWERSREDLNAEQSKIEEVAKGLCWKKLAQLGDIAIWQKPTNHVHCKKAKSVFKMPRFCQNQNPDQAWYTNMEECLTPLPEVSNLSEMAGGPIAKWPARVNAVPPRILTGILKEVTPDLFKQDVDIWKKRISYFKALSSELGQRGRYRNFLDMNANLGGFAASLVDDPVWVMNVVPVEAKIDTLGAIFERGLIGTYQSWCEAMSTYPRTYDFIHADSVFSLYEGRCEMEDILLEMDRILRPEGCVIFIDDVDTIVKIKKNTDGMQWESRIFDHEKGPIHREKLLVAVKQYWTAPATSIQATIKDEDSLKEEGVRLVKWRFLDLVMALFSGTVFIFLLLVYTPFGDSFAASGRQALLRPTAAVRPGLHLKMAAMVESGEQTAIDSCPVEYVDYMPCEDPKRNSQLSREMNFYRERHCPLPEESPLCLIPPPKGYKISVSWPESLHKIWHGNMPYNKIADRKGHQGWMKEEGPYFIFPGGGTMFPDGAVQYIERLGRYIPIGGGVLRTALDMGCGVASFGGYLLSEKIMTVSFAPRDSHKSQIQFALERGVPAFVAMLGTRRLPFPAFSFDLVHCSRCLIPFAAYNATYFIEVDRLLRPGGYFVVSGPPVQWPKQDKEWADLQAVAKALCYEVITINGNTVIWKKPTGDSCLSNQNELELQLCDESEDPSYAWYYKLNKCVSRTSHVKGDLGVGDIPKWPERLHKAPLRASQMRNGFEVFESDTNMWIRRIAYYKNSLNVNLGTPSIRNVMDMNAFLGGFAASIISDPVWVMNVVPSLKQLTLDVIYDRGLIGVYHDWCEPFSTYPRTYDLMHVIVYFNKQIRVSCLLLFDQHFILYQLLPLLGRCYLADLMVEMDRILRPQGTVIVRDSPEIIQKVKHVAHAMRWTTTIHENEPDSLENEQILVAKKTFWK